MTLEPPTNHRRRMPVEVEALLDAFDERGNPMTTRPSERPVNALRDSRAREILRAFLAGKITRDEVHERLDAQPDIENVDLVRWFA